MLVIMLLAVRTNESLFSFVCQVKLVNIHRESVVDGNQTLVLGLIWAIIHHYQVQFAQCCIQTFHSKLSVQSVHDPFKVLKSYLVSELIFIDNIN